MNYAKRKIVADLHTHSTASDGECSPAEVVRLAQLKGYQAVALTDHDTISGLEEAKNAAAEIKITFVPGIELSVCYKRPWFTGSLHLLAYFPVSNLSESAFSQELMAILSGGRGQKLLLARIAAINQLFGPSGTIDPILKHELDASEIIKLNSAKSITRRHFAQALKQHHDLDDVKVNKLIANTSPAYIPSGIELASLKPLIEKFPLIKVLAHPAAGSFPGPGTYREVLPPFETVVGLLPEFLELGLDGLEVFYPGHTLELINNLINIANDNKLLITGGSDFHDIKARPMGTAGVTEEELFALINMIKNNQ